MEHTWDHVCILANSHSYKLKINDEILSAYELKTKHWRSCLIPVCLFSTYNTWRHRSLWYRLMKSCHFNYVLICVTSYYINVSRIPSRSQNSRLSEAGVSIHSHESIFEVCEAFVCSLAIISSLSITLNWIWHKCQTLMIWLSAPLTYGPRSARCVRDRRDRRRRERSLRFNFPPSNRQRGTGSDNTARAWKTTLG